MTARRCRLLRTLDTVDVALGRARLHDRGQVVSLEVEDLSAYLHYRLMFRNISETLFAQGAYLDVYFNA